MPRKTLFEACVESADFALAAEKGGADRIELCTSLEIGGVTPELDAAAKTITRLKIPVHVLVRPRGGDFCYSESEFNVMCSDVERLKRIGASGVVIGVLDTRKAIDTHRTRSLVELARPMAVTFHRAFDEVIDPLRAVDNVIGLGIERLLTSGQTPNAFEGIDLLGKLAEKSHERLSVMPGGGVNEQNAVSIIQKTGAHEIHGSLQKRGERLTAAEYAERVSRFVAKLP